MQGDQLKVLIAIQNLQMQDQSLTVRESYTFIDVSGLLSRWGVGGFKLQHDVITALPKPNAPNSLAAVRRKTTECWGQ